MSIVVKRNLLRSCMILALNFFSSSLLAATYHAALEIRINSLINTSESVTRVIPFELNIFMMNDEVHCTVGHKDNVVFTCKIVNDMIEIAPKVLKTQIEFRSSLFPEDMFKPFFEDFLKQDFSPLCVKNHYDVDDDLLASNVFFSRQDDSNTVKYLITWQIIGRVDEKAKL